MGRRPDTILSVTRTRRVRARSPLWVVLALSLACQAQAAAQVSLQANPTDAILAVEDASKPTAPATSAQAPSQADDSGGPGERARATGEELAPAAAPTPRTELLPIGPAPSKKTGDADDPASSSSNSLVRTVSGLGLVVGLIFLLRWGVKHAAVRMGTMSAQLGPAGRAPSGVLSVLARYPAGRGQSFVLLKLDQRVLLLNQTPDGFRLLTQMTEPEEVASILIKTRDEQGESIASRFSSLLRRFESDPDVVDRDVYPEGNAAPARVSSVFPDTAAERITGADDPLASIRQRLANLQEAQV